MRRAHLLFALALSACAGSPPPPPAPPPAPPGPLLPVHVTPPPPPDPSTPFRRAYTNPGGMWLPQQLTAAAHVDTLAKLGFELDPKTFADPLAAPLAAVVYLGGCTGSFVSPEGLVVTNHHCVQGALQLNSTPESNLVKDGFLAKTRAEERPAGPAQRILVAQAFRDVTREMQGDLEKVKDPVARKEESDKRGKQLVAACEKDRPGVRCQVSTFFGGGLYELIEMLEIRDVRLVYAPARSVGNYGGEIDNWAWPRHGGDFSFYRAYVGKDGKPADYAADNVPYQPKVTLTVSTAGLAQGDLVMVTGYPARTSRTDTAKEIHHAVEWWYPQLIAFYKERYAIAEAHANDAGETGIKAGVLQQGVQNGLENFEGTLAGLTKGTLLAQKDELDAKVKAWAATTGNEAYKQAIDHLEEILAEKRKTSAADFARGNAFGASRMLSTALGLTRWAEERAKKDEDRKPGYQERDLPRAVGAQKQLAKQYDRTLDKEVLRLVLVRALALPEAERPWLRLLLGARAGAKLDAALVDATLAAWFGAQKLEDEKLRLELLQKGTTKDLAATKDPFLAAAARVWATFKADEKKQDARTGDLLLVVPAYVEGMKQVLGGMLAPDANATLRVTYGTVRSLKPESSAPADRPFTVASQIPAKDTGKEPFNAPAKLLEAIAAKKFGAYADRKLGGELPIDFLSDLDITGGNSGSPTLNKKGELVGLAFDGNIEGVASNVVFDGTTTRTIHVDARYMVWTMDTLDGAKHLVKEMGLTPSP